MQLRETHYFVTIVEEGSLSKAAKKLFLTQPTLSHFLTRLEHELGTELFRRKNGSLELTAAGQEYYAAARQIERTWQDMEQALASRQSGSERRIRCGTGGTDIVLKKLNYCLPALRERFPELMISTVSNNPRALTAMMLNGELDLIYAAYREKDPRIVYHEITTCEVDLVVPKGDPMAAYSYQLPGNENVRISLADAGDRPFALLTKEAILRELEDDYFDKIGYYPIEAANYTLPPSVREFVCHQGFYGLCARMVHSKDMAYIALDPPMYYTCGIYYRRYVRLSPATRFFIEQLKKYPFDYEI